MKKRAPSSLIVLLILGLAFFGSSALLIWFRLSNTDFSIIESSKNQTQTSSPNTSESKKRQSNLKGPSWEYHNPKVDNLILELNRRIREQDKKEEELEEKYTLIRQTENRLESLRQKIEQLKNSMQALTPKEETNKMEPATINRYLEMFKNLDPEQISLILDSNTDEEIGLIWASMKEADVAELMAYWATERKDRFKSIKEAFDKASAAQPLNP